MSTKTITVRVDESTKQQAETILGDIGLNLTGFINASLKAVVREKRVPFAMVSSEYEEQRQVIRMKLAESEAAASDPDAARYSHDEIFGALREKYDYEV